MLHGPEPEQSPLQPANTESLSAVALYVMHDFTLEHVLTAAKIGLIVVFVYITSPTATHAIVDAGMRAGLKPWEKKVSNDLAD